MVEVSPYATAIQLDRPAPVYVPNPDDRDRVRAYFTYSDVFNNVNEAFEKVLRVEDDPKSRRYIPAARGMVEAINRYLCRTLELVGSVPPDVTVAPELVATTMFQLESLLRREEFVARFGSMKRWMLIKGDGLLHVSADPLKPEGTRIRIVELEPEHYFPIYAADDAERVVGCYLVHILVQDTTSVAQRTEYRRILTEEDVATYGFPLGSVFYRVGFYEVDKWDDRPPYFTEADLARLGVPDWIEQTESLALAMQGFALPAQITSLPVYHFKNNRRGNRPFGTSELQGVESALAGITQNATDEDMAVALMGIGVYATDSGHPVDAQGQEVGWAIAPAAVIELTPGGKFVKVPGVTTVEPVQDHVDFLKREAREAAGIPDVAVGKVDVQVAQSGIALAIQFDPLLSKTGEKEVTIKAKGDQLLHDLINGWMPAYESQGGNGVVAEMVFGPPLPTNRKEFLEEVSLMLDKGIIDADFARELLAEHLGISFPDDMAARVAQAQAQALDAVGSRMDSELAAG